ncbi:MAG: hypothetical protein ABR538_01035 [Candidatus Binatia bacterium]
MHLLLRDRANARRPVIADASITLVSAATGLGLIVASPAPGSEVEFVQIGNFHHAFRPSRVRMIVCGRTA